MSRHYRKKGEGWVRKYSPKPYSAAWKAVRAARKAARDRTPEQTRDKLGFIVRVGAEGGTETYDPGVIDRWLWVQANPDDE